jgi:hypothetical protein
MSEPIDGNATGHAERIADLEEGMRAMKELLLLYCHIAFRDGFRAGITYVPDHWNYEAETQASAWVAERSAKFESDMAEITAEPKEA